MIAGVLGDGVRAVGSLEEAEAKTRAEADPSAALRDDKQNALRNDIREGRDDKQEGRDDKQEGLASPGMGMRHYAPRARLVLVRGQRELMEEVRRCAAAEVGVMLPKGWDAGGAGVVFAWGGWDDAEGLARRLFAGLRALDEAGVGVIVCPVPEMGGLGEALRDRLEKAARTL
jgi:hypothetical protein